MKGISRRPGNIQQELKMFKQIKNHNPVELASLLTSFHLAAEQGCPFNGDGK